MEYSPFLLLIMTDIAELQSTAILESAFESY